MRPSGGRWQAGGGQGPVVPGGRLPPSRDELTIVKQWGVKQKHDAVSSLLDHAKPGRGEGVVLTTSIRGLG